jgi:TonB family protein
MTTTESNIEINSGPAPTGIEQRQRRRMLIALGLLVVALGVLLFKDRQFWFTPSQSVDSESIDQAPASSTPVSATTATATTPTTATNSPTQAPPISKPAPPVVASRPKKTRNRTSHPVKAAAPKLAPAPQVAMAQDVPESSQASAEGPVVTTTNRTILLPLEVEVQAGNQHRPVSTSNNNSVKVDMQSTASAAFGGKTPAPESQPDPTTVESAEARFSLSPGTAERVARSVKPDYPLLAKQMKVQGAVVLQALIDKSGSIEDLRVLTGPSILATAAREAVRQWRFKPYYENGEPVETEARITVNFTISTY